MEEIRIICCDIDGTLVRDDKTMSEENIRWIRKAVEEKGIRFTLVSGRPESGIRPFYEKLGITGPVSAFNGGILIDEDGNNVDDHRVPHDIAIQMVDISKRSKADMIIFDGSDWYLETRDCYAYRARVGMYLKDCLVGDFTELLHRFDTNKCFFVSDDQESLDKAEELILQEVDLSRIVYHKKEDYLELTARDYDKGTAITALAKSYNVPTSQIMAIGDADNDESMLCTAGISVAMANATQKAKDAAKYSTDSNNNDGVAKAIQRFVFGITSQKEEPSLS